MGEREENLVKEKFFFPNNIIYVVQERENQNGGLKINNGFYDSQSDLRKYYRAFFTHSIYVYMLKCLIVYSECLDGLLKGVF